MQNVKRYFKRCLSLFLCIVMVFSVFAGLNITVSAADVLIEGTSLDLNDNINVKGNTLVSLDKLPIISESHYTGNLGDSRVFNLDGKGLIGNDGDGYRYGNEALDGSLLNNGFEVWIARWNYGDNISWASATFALNGKYNKLKGKTDIIKSYNTTNYDTTVYFYNGDKLLSSYRITPNNYKMDINIDVSAIDELTLLVKDNIKTAGGTSFALYDMFLDGSQNSNASISSMETIDTLRLTARNTDSWLSGSVGNESIFEASGSLNWSLSNATIKIGSQEFTQDENKQFLLKKADITDDLILSRDDYYNYIIPKEVALSLFNKGNTNIYDFVAYMTKDKKNGKPYISTVFAREAGSDKPYTNIQVEEITISEDKSYEFCITPVDSSGVETYYISQDNSHKTTSSKGNFTVSNLTDKLFSDRDTYVYFKTKTGKTSASIPVKIKFEEINNNSVLEELSKGKLNVGGSEGLSITLPNDWLLIGGSTIDLADFSFPIGFQYDEGKCRVSVGFDWCARTATTNTSYSSIDKSTQQEYVTKSTTTYENNNVWDNIKAGIKGSANTFKNYKDKTEALKSKKKLCERYGIDVKDLGNSNVSKTKFNVESLGYIEGEFVDGEFIVTDMLISVAGEFTISYTVQLSSGYLGLEGGGKLTVTTDWSRETADLDKPLEFGFSFNVTPEIKARGGVGWDGIASAGVYGKGTMPTNLITKDNEINISITGEFGYEAQFLFWSTGEKTLLSGTFGPKTFYYGKNSVNKSLSLSANGLDTEDNNVALILTERVEPSVWLGETSASASKARKARIGNAEQLSFTTLQNNIFARSETEIITAGDTTLAVWTAEDENRDEYNRLKLVYSVYNSANDTWSEPKAVYDDGHIDSSPALATDGENIYVTWQKYCKTYTAENSTDLVSVLSASEVYLAKYDAVNDAFINAERLTENEVYDYSPTATVVDGETVVFYATNPSNVIMSENGNTISKNENGTTSVIKSNLANVQNLTSGNVNGVAECAYAVDTDGDLETTEDIAVFYGSDTFTQFDKFYDNEPVLNMVYADWNGTTTLFVSDDANIYYGKDDVATPVLAEATKISGRLQAVNDDDGLSFYWLSSTENGNELYTAGEVDGEWTDAVCLTERGNKFSNLALTYADYQVLGLVNETGVTYDETSNTYINGETDLTFIKENDFLDLELTSLDIEEENLAVGENAPVCVWIENNGNIKADSFTFTLTDSLGIQKEYLVEETLLPGKSLYWQLPYTIPDNFASSTLTVSVSNDGVDDIDNSNNTLTHTADRAFLVASDLKTVEIGGAYVLSANVTNRNFANAENVTAVVKFTSADGEEISSANVGVLAQEELSVAEFAFAESDIPFGEDDTCIAYIIVSADNAESTVSSCIIEKQISGCDIGNHVEVVDETVEPTCTEPGLTEGSHCFICDEVIVAQQVIEATGHNTVTTLPVDPTVTESGLTEGYHCSICGLVFKEQEPVRPLGYTINLDSEKVFACYDDTILFAPAGDTVTYQWYATNNADLSKSVAVRGATSTDFSPMDYYGGGNESKYKYFYCVANVEINGVKTKTTSPMCLNAFALMEESDYSIVDYENAIIYTDSISNVNDYSDIISIGVAEGLTTTFAPSYQYGETKSYGTGSTITLQGSGAGKTTFTIIMYGDTNGDSVVDVLDAAAVAKVSTNQATLDGAYSTAADINGDGNIDVNDYSAVVNKAVS